MRRLILLVFLPVQFSSGCYGDMNSATSRPEKELQAQVAAMKSQLDEIQKSVWQLQFELNSEKDRYQSTVFDTSSKGYQRIDTTSGTFLVSLEDIKQYGDGYKLLLKVGNPSSATYSGFSMRAKWGKSFNAVGDYSKWQGQIHEQNFSYTEKLMSSSWNKVYLVLAPAQKEDLGYIEISLETDVIFLTER